MPSSGSLRGSSLGEVTDVAGMSPARQLFCRPRFVVRADRAASDTRPSLIAPLAGRREERSIEDGRR